MHQSCVKSILSSSHSMNVYRGCSHGCIYCDARSACYQYAYPLEDIEIKENIYEVLKRELVRSKSKFMIQTGGMSDPYLPLERQLEYTKQCLSLIERYGFGVCIQTKSPLILRDLELIKKIHAKAKCVVEMTLTTYDEVLCKKIEPNVATTKERLSALSIFKKEHIPTIVWLSPILPGINDTEENIRNLIRACHEVGVKGILCFEMGLTLRKGNREYFYQKLEEAFPGMKEKYERYYKSQYRVVSSKNDSLMRLFHQECKKYGMLSSVKEIFHYLNEFPEEKEKKQLKLFE